MDKIASFTVNHLDLIPGVYVSRKDYVGKEVMMSGKKKLFTLDQWAVVPDVILSLQVTMNLKTLLVLYAILLLLSLITKVKFLEPLQKTAEIILIRIFQWPIILQKNI